MLPVPSLSRIPIRKAGVFGLQKGDDPRVVDCKDYSGNVPDDLIKIWSFPV